MFLTSILVFATAVGENVLAGVPAKFSPAPSYSLCTDVDDCRQLTDGVHVRAGELMWGQKAAVGWRCTRMLPYVVDFDLGRSCLFGGFSVTTSGGASGVRFPSAVNVFTSDDGVSWRYAGDLWAKSAEKRGYPDFESYGTWTAESRQMPCRGRYLRFIATNAGQYLFFDEIEAYVGADETGAAACPVVADPAGSVRDLKYNAALSRAAFRLNVLGKYGARIAQAKFAHDVPDRKAILPYPGLHAEIAAENSANLVRAGVKEPSFWTAKDKWANLDMFQIPPTETIPVSPLTVRMMRGETRSAAVNLVNPTRSALTCRVHLEGLPEGVNCDLREVLHSDTQGQVPVAAALRPGAGTSIDFVLPAGISKQVWVRFVKPGVKPGVYRGRLVADLEGGRKLSVPVGLKIVATAVFPSAPKLHVYGWDYLDGVDAGCYRYNAPRAADGNLREMRALHADIFWANITTVPKKGAGETLDFAAWDRWMARCPDSGILAVFINLGVGDKVNSFLGMHPDQPDFLERASGYFRKWAEHVRATTPGHRVALLLFDEPRVPGAAAKIVPFFQAVKKGAPDFLIFEDPVFDRPEAEDPRFYELCDVFCPNVQRMQACPDSVKFFLDLARKGKRLWLYECAGPSRLRDPITYYRMQPYLAAHLGAEGVGYWAFGCGGGIGDSFRPYDQTGIEYSPYFVTGDDAMMSKQSEGIREGVEDFECLRMLARKNPQLAKAYAAEAIGVPADGEASLPGDRQTWENNEPAHLRYENVRLKVLRALSAAD